jgi:predicted acyl esterase
MHASPRSLALAAALLVIASPAIAQNTPAYPSETPANFQPTNYNFDYQRREVMIPMRDGVKLHTVILVPNGAKNAPILFTRTPTAPPS